VKVADTVEVGVVVRVELGVGVGVRVWVMVGVPDEGHQYHTVTGRALTGALPAMNDQLVAAAQGL